MPTNKCSICEEKWFDMHFHKELGICNRCRNEKHKDKVCHTFSKENNMIPGPQPQCLKVLNDVEKAAIKLIKPSLYIYKRKGGGVGFSGNCISFAQDVCTFAENCSGANMYRVRHMFPDTTILVLQGHT